MSSLYLAQGSRMIGVELLDQPWRVYILGVLPAIVLIAVALPLDEVLESSPKHTTVEYCSDLILFVAIDQDGVRRRPTPMSMDWIRRSWYQFDHWENGVEMAHGFGQVETVCIGSDTALYNIGTQETMC